MLRMHERALWMNAAYGMGFAVDLVVCFASPLDGNSEEKRTATEGEPVSFMQTSAGAARIVQTCEELLSVLEESKGFSCEILEAVDIVILQFPPAAGTLNSFSPRVKARV